MSDSVTVGALDEAGLTELGHALGASVAAQPTGVFIGLRGDLGAGKSVLARAIAAGAGVRDAMPSPTFNLVFRYSTAAGPTVAHLDLYRLNDPDEVWELGWEELSGGTEIALVEWPERAAELLPRDRWDIALVHGHDSATRILRAERLGAAPALPTTLLRRARIAVRHP